MNEEKNTKKTVSSKKKLTVTVAVAVLVCIMINFAVCLLPNKATHLDISGDKLYSLADTTKNYLAAVENETTVYVLDADGSDERFEYFMESIDACNEKLTVKFARSGSEEMQEVMQRNSVSTDIYPYSVLVEGKNGATFISYEDMMFYQLDSSLVSFVGTERLDTASLRECAAYIDTMMAQDTDNAASYEELKTILLTKSERIFCGEEIICRMVEYVNLDYFPARYFVTGHGEKNLNKTQLGYSILSVCASYSISYYKELDMSTGATIPQDAVSLIVLDPTKDFSVEEARMFIDYINRGGDVIFITSDACLAMPNLMSVMNEYGLYSDGGTVSELKKKDENDENSETYMSEAVDAIVNTNHDAFAWMAGSEMSVVPSIKNANPISYNNIKPNVSLTPLLTTPENAYVGDKTGNALSIAAAAEDIIGGGKLLWFTGAESYNQEYDSTATGTTEDGEIDEEYYTMLYNMSTVMSTVLLSPMTYETEVVSVDPKPFAKDMLNVNGKIFVSYTVIMAVSVLIVLTIGGIVCYKRKKR